MLDHNFSKQTNRHDVDMYVACSYDKIFQFV